MQEVQREAERHNIKLLVLPTTEAIEVLRREPKGTNAILTSHVECLHSGGDCTISVAIDSGQGTGGIPRKTAFAARKLRDVPFIVSLTERSASHVYESC